MSDRWGNLKDWIFNQIDSREAADQKTDLMLVLAKMRSIENEDRREMRDFYRCGVGPFDGEE